MMNNSKDPTISEFLASNFEIAWTISEWIENEKKSVLLEYWIAVQRILDERLASQNISNLWKTTMSDHMTKGYSLCIHPVLSRVDKANDAGWQPPCYSINVEEILAGSAGCYYGIRGWTKIENDTFMGLATPLLEKLESQLFRMPHLWFLAYKWAKDDPTLPDFQRHNKKAVLELVEDAARGCPKAVAFADAIWSLFIESRLMLEPLNATLANGHAASAPPGASVS